jgi:TatD DNase family protein
MRLIDTHAHLCDPAFAGDIAEVMQRAADAGIEAVVAVAETLEDARRNLELAGTDRRILSTAGLYPTWLDREAASGMCDWIRRHRHQIVAIGEVGLDRWKVKDDEGRAVQEEIFLSFVDLAAELDLPLNIHSRSSGRRVIELLLDKGASRVHLHAFDGKPGTAMPAVEAGYLFSIPPSVVRSRQKQKLVRRLPLECLMVETDSPVLGPVPDVRNEPAHAAMAVRAIAELKGIPEEEVAEATRENTRRLYVYSPDEG